MRLKGNVIAYTEEFKTEIAKQKILPKIYM